MDRLRHTLPATQPVRTHHIIPSMASGTTAVFPSCCPDGCCISLVAAAGGAGGGRCMACCCRFGPTAGSHGSEQAEDPACLLWLYVMMVRVLLTNACSWVAWQGGAAARGGVHTSLILNQHETFGTWAAATQVQTHRLAGPA